jgi:small-conductance mechanosensitive channel
VEVATGLARVGIVLGGLFAGAAALGLPYEGVIAGLGIGGLAIAIAARDSVSNFIGAAILLADRPFQRGDLIDSSGLMGTVEHVGLRSTRIRTLDDTLLVVPNSKLADGLVNNWGRQRSRQVKLQLRVPNTTPRDRLDSFVAGLKEVFEMQPLGQPGATIEITEIAETSILIQVQGRLRTKAYADLVEFKNQFFGDALDLARSLKIDISQPVPGGAA